MSTRAKSKIIREVLERLRPELSGPPPRNGVRGQLQIEAPPLDPPTIYHGINLTDLMLPEARAPDELIVEAFSKLAFQKVAPQLLDTPPAWSGLGPGVSRFVDDDPERFLLWASRKPGAVVDYGEKSMMLSLPGGTRLGVDEGQYQCKFNQYLPQHHVTLRGFKNPTSVLTRDKTFILLYGRASSEDRVFLAAARVAFKDTFEGLAPWVYGRSEPELRQKVEQALMQEQHPFLQLYRILVPRLLTQTRFTRMFGDARDWSENPTTSVRERAYFRLIRIGLI